MNIYVCNNKEKEAINLKGSEEGYMEIGKGRNKCCNYILYLKEVCCFNRICIYDSDLNWPLWIYVCLFVATSVLIV